ncbi:TetR/AcrR family transcriptional regulator [Periweissella cryptocerci]|uniref:TetR/AcrR family transcriptional regulator n=1 Tax=Periweissella cryptocerci TaxID=2506420 RepID=A0A4P6YR15_9LACO|nr:TetR/AcrR family transcriptional regulator [Periweissella cryptocerci]QBO35051.1 TetR/AcrR family transcriptional regulator [Periweissella cryptocerci]
MPQSAVSLKYLKQALAEVLVRKELNNVTVQDIVRQAEVGRSTFYRHFLNLDDFYDWLQATMLDDILGQFAMGETDNTDFLKFYEYATENRILLQSFLKNRPWPEFSTRLYTVVLNNYMQLLATRPNSIPARIRAEFLIGGQISLVQWWLGETNPPTPQQMAKYHNELTSL